MSIDEIASKLADFSLHGNNPDVKNVMNQLLLCVKLSDDLGPLVSPVVKLLPTHDGLMKKVLYQILPSLAKSKPEISYLVANTVVKDCGDPNPLVRSIALKTLCAIPGLTDYVPKPLSQGFGDANPKVRRCVVLGILALFRHSPRIVKDLGVINKLYEMVRDPDPLVVTDSLLTLRTILSEEGGVVINHNMASYLVRRIKDFPEFQLAAVLELLMKHKPRSEEDLFGELDILDEFLSYESCAVLSSCIALFLHLLQDYDQPRHDIVKRVYPTLQNLMAKASSEEVYCMIEFLVGLEPEWIQSFSSNPSVLFPKKTDSVPVVIKKLQVLPLLCTQSNFLQIVKQVSHYCEHPHICVEALVVLCSIPKHCAAADKECLSVLQALINANSSSAASSVVDALQKVDVTVFQEKDMAELVSKLMNKVDLVSHPESLPASIPKLLGDFAVHLKDAPYVMEIIVDNFEKYREDTKHVILSATLKLFFLYPAIAQDILGQVLEKCVHDNCVDLSQRAQQYYYLLLKDVHLVKSIIFG